MPPRPLRACLLSCRLAGALGLVVLVGLSLLSATARTFWLGEIVRNLAWQVALGGMLAALLLLAGRAVRSGVLAGALSLAHAAPALALLLPAPTAPPAAGPEAVFAVSNVLYRNTDLGPFVAWARAERPDVLAVLEHTPASDAALDGLRDIYPHQVRVAGDPFGMALVSRHPLLDVRRHETPWRDFPYLEARVLLAGRSVRVLALHPQRAGRPWRLRDRDALLAHAAERTDWSGPVVVLADLNATVASPAYADFLRVAGLRDTRQGFGRAPTWRNDEVVPGCWLDLDAILVRGPLAVLDRGTGPDVGSDHRPAWARLALGLGAREAGPVLEPRAAR